jgi:hypothetical protein
VLEEIVNFSTESQAVNEFAVEGSQVKRLHGLNGSRELTARICEPTLRQIPPNGNAGVVNANIFHVVPGDEQKKCFI